MLYTHKYAQLQPKFLVHHNDTTKDIDIEIHFFSLSPFAVRNVFQQFSEQILFALCSEATMNTFDKLEKSIESTKLEGKM